jgi:hypothetical protein
MSRKLSLSPPPTKVPTGLPNEWMKWFTLMYEQVLISSGTVKVYTNLAEAPNPSELGNTSSDNPFSTLIYVTAGADNIYYSNGSNWIPLQDS